MNFNFNQVYLFSLVNRQGRGFSSQGTLIAAFDLKKVVGLDLIGLNWVHGRGS